MGFTASYAHHNGRAKPYTLYYRCASAQKRRQEQAKCPFHNINADQIEQHVIKAIAAIADDHSGWLDEICQRIQASAAPAAAHLQTERQAILDEQRAATKQLDNALAFIKRAGTHARKRLLNEITKLERKLDELTQELAEKDRGIAAAAPVRANPDEHATPPAYRTQPPAKTIGQHALLDISNIGISFDDTVYHVVKPRTGDLGAQRRRPQNEGSQPHSNRPAACAADRT